MLMKFKELDTVQTTTDFFEYGIAKGDIGAIVVAFTYPKEAYEIEFVNDDGTRKAMFAIGPEDLEKIYDRKK